ncbi:hypothetical protein CXG81DRAFT_4884, partial [Caulochytrium protostelioides]
YDAGHQIASHTWSHPVMTSITDAQIIAELMWSGKIIEEVTGQFPRYWRPPQGEIDSRVRRLSSALGMHAVIWDHDTNDWQIPGGTRTAEEALAEVEDWMDEYPENGLSLEHDLYVESAGLAPAILDLVRNAGYQIKPAADCNG